MDQARLLPRFRPGAAPLLERDRMIRAQSAALLDAIDRNPDAPIPPRYELTKPGDPLALRGVPLVGAAAGAIAGTRPEQETIRRVTARERVNERTGT